MRVQHAGPVLPDPRPVPAPGPGPVVSAVFPPSPRSVGEARRLVAGACAANGVDPDVRDTAVLLTSEAVTNAFTHGRSAARLAAWPTPSGVHVEVADDNSRAPQLRPDDPGALDGRGMTILAVAAARWGVRHEGIGKTVWFEVESG